MREDIKKQINGIWQTKKVLIILIAILILGAGLRLININSEPYWSDEILSLQIAKHYIGNPYGLWKYLQIAEIHPPLYYYLIQSWGKIFGFNEGAIRSLSLIFSLGLIYLTYLAGVTLFKNKKIGLLAAFFTAILPFQIEYGQEARPYAIFSFLGVLSLILLARYFETKKNKRKLFLISGFIISSILGLYLHYSYLLILIPLSLYWLGKIIIEKISKEFLWWLSTMTIIFLGFYVWLPALIFKSFLINQIISFGHRNLYILRPLSFFEDAFNNLIWPDKQSSSVIEILTTVLVKVTWMIMLGFVIIKNQDWLKKYKRNLIYLAFLLLSSMGLFLSLPSSNKYTTFLYRHLLFDLNIIALFLAALFIKFTNKRWPIIWLSLFIISLLTFQVKILANDSVYDINHRFKIIVEYINQYYQKDDMLMVAKVYVRPQFNYYLRSDLPGFIGILPAELILPDFMATKQTLGVIENEAQLRVFTLAWPKLDKKMRYLIKKNQPKRIWVVGDSKNDIIRNWFVYNHWRIGFEPIKINGKNLFPLTLYVRPKTNK